MRCAKVDRWVERFVDGALDAARALQIEEHLQSCMRCSARVVAARSLINAFETPTDRAPPGFAVRVMDAVYRETSSGRQRSSASTNQETLPSRLPALIYRRLGLTFVLTAGVLAASLFVPRAAYPVLLGTGSAAGLSREGGAAVHGVLIGADSVVRGILREQANGGSVR